MGQNKVIDKLKRLYELAKLRPEEEGDEARMNEARTSAFLLLKIARENGVQVKFLVPKSAAAPPERETPSVYSGFYGRDNADFSDLFRKARRVVDEPFKAPNVRAKKPAAEKKKPAAEEKKPAAEKKKPAAEEKTSGQTVLEVDPGGAILFNDSAYSGFCRHCRRSFQVGDPVWWLRGYGCTHFMCSPIALYELQREREHPEDPEEPINDEFEFLKDTGGRW